VSRDSWETAKQSDLLLVDPDCSDLKKLKKYIPRLEILLTMLYKKSITRKLQYRFGTNESNNNLKKFMKSKDKDQDKHQEELEKTSEKIDSVDEHRDILSRNSRR
jgi:hypothetical protein